jgi:hypothetical protein
MSRIAPLLIVLLVAACAEPPPPALGVPPSPVVYNIQGGGPIGCQTWGFETICRKN